MSAPYRAGRLKVIMAGAAVVFFAAMITLAVAS